MQKWIISKKMIGYLLPCVLYYRKLEKKDQKKIDFLQHIFFDGVLTFGIATKVISKN